MADNIALNAGSGGATIATDDDGTAHHQYVKLEFGADNTQTKVTAAVGLPVSDAGGSLTVDGSVSVTGTVTVDGSGVTQPVSLASVPSHPVTNAGTFAVQADTELTTSDLDTGAGTDTRAVVGLVYGASGGGTLVSTTNPLPVGDNGGSLTVDNAGTFATQAAQSGTWNITNVSGTVSLPTGASTAAKQPALGTAGTASGDVITVQGVASMTKLLVTPDSVALPANQSVNVAQINGVTTTMGNGASGTGVQRVTLANDSTGVLATVSTVTTVSTLTGGGIAHDGADSGNPIKIGAKAETSPKGITLVADADRTDLYADADGLMMVKLNTSGADAISEAISNTDGASTAFTNFSAVASTKNYITAYTAFRTDAGSTMAYIDLRDGTAGSVLWRIPLPPTGGAVSPPYNGPCLFKTSANTALAFDVSSALTTVYLSVAGYQSKV